jgi:hypothetical protein
MAKVTKKNLKIEQESLVNTNKKTEFFIKNHFMDIG